MRKFNDDVDRAFDNFDVRPLKTANDDNGDGGDGAGGGNWSEGGGEEVTLATSGPFQLSESESDAESLPPAPVTYMSPSLRPSISHSIESMYSFTSDVCNYRCGVFGTCEITHIIDSVECICCMVDFERYGEFRIFIQLMSDAVQ